MNANELRIGNWVHVKGLHGNLFMTVSSITGKGSLIESQRVIFFEEDKERVGEFLEHCHPIPLTPEILGKAGFEESGFYVYKGDVRLYSYHSDFTVDEGFIFDYGMVRSFLNVKYLHQLQNLYFALTGEELEVNL